jgi:hypothetical protein
MTILKKNRNTKTYKMIKIQTITCVLVKVNLRNRDKLLVGCIYKSLSSSDENHDKLNELLLYISKLEDSYTHILFDHCVLLDLSVQYSEYSYYHSQ